MGENMKLTKAQRDFLQSMRSGRRGASDAYKPAQRLTALGLIARVSSSFGTSRFELTDAGRAALPPTETPDDRL